jgi:hypothetical protein
MNRLFHIAYYLDPIRKIKLSGKSYMAESVLDALKQFVEDGSTPSMDSIRYISDESNMVREENLVMSRLSNHG